MKYLGIIIICCYCVVLKAQHRQRINDEKFSAHKVKKLAISSENTDYIITGHSDTTVIVSITAITNTPKKMEELQKNYKIVTDLQNEVLRVETFTGDAKGEFLVEISVPQNIILDISTQNSQITIQRTNNDIQLMHHAKPIVLNEVRGGKVHINSKNGEVTIKNSSGDIQVNTNKSVEAEMLEGQITCISGSHQTITLKKSIPTLLNTQNGNIKLKIPSDAQFDCRFTSDIPIKLEWNNFRFEGSMNLKTLTGKLNQGNIPLKITANKGGIWVSN